MPIVQPVLPLLRNFQVYTAHNGIHYLISFPIHPPGSIKPYDLMNPPHWKRNAAKNYIMVPIHTYINVNTAASCLIKQWR